jgi:hypothetical protein
MRLRGESPAQATNTVAGGKTLTWNGDRGGIAVEFDEEGHALEARFFYAHAKIKWWYWVLWDLRRYWVRDHVTIEDWHQ